MSEISPKCIVSVIFTCISHRHFELDTSTTQSSVTSPSEFTSTFPKSENAFHLSRLKPENSHSADIYQASTMSKDFQAVNI